MPDLVDWLVEHEPTFRKSRLPSLYSDLAVQKTTNPDGFAANVLAWQSALIRAAEAGQLPSEQRLLITSSENLLDALATAQYGRPSGLGLVLDETVKSGKMMDLKEFQDTELSIYHRSWIPKPLAILKWGLKQAGLTGNASYDNSGRLRPGQLVSIPALEDAYKEISAAQTKSDSNLTDRIMTRETFAGDLARLQKQPLSSQDIDILLRYLERDKGILSYDFKTVKFKSSATESPEPITNEDTTIANLKSLISGLEIQITNLNSRISTLQKNAKTAVESKNKSAALSALRSKKLAETTLQQRTDTLTQLEQVYIKIEQAVDQLQIVEVMQSSVTVLKGLNKRIGGVEKVEDVVEELREEMSKVDEVGQVLQEPVDGKMVIDEVELDDELEELERAERKREEEREAEVTKRRLAELERAERQQKIQQETKQRQTQDESDVELKMRNSIERLERMKLNEGENVVAGKQSDTGGDREKEKERVPEPAS